MHDTEGAMTIDLEPDERDALLDALFTWRPHIDRLYADYPQAVKDTMIDAGNRALAKLDPLPGSVTDGKGVPNETRHRPDHYHDSL